MAEFIGQEIKRIRDLVGPEGQVLGAVSGGVDSTVAAKVLSLFFLYRYRPNLFLVNDGCHRISFSW